MDKEARLEFLIQVFGEFGEVTEKNITLITDRETGDYKAFCFVEMESECAEAAIAQLDGAIYEDERIELVVNVAKPKEDSPRGGGYKLRGGGYNNDRYNDRR